MDFVLDNINLKIDFTSNKVESKDNLILDLNYKSYFPKGTKLELYNVKENNKDMKLYRINEEGGWELVKGKVDFENNVVSLNFEKGDLYVIANTSNEPNYLFIIITQSIVIVLGLIECIYVTYKYVRIKLADK